MQLNRSQFLTNISDEKLNTKNLETEFEHYPIFTNNKQGSTLYKTQDGIRSRDNLRIKEKNRMMQFRQNSAKELHNTLNKVHTKRLTHRGNKHLNVLNMSGESTKFIQDMNKTQNKVLNDKNLPYTSPKKKVKNSSDWIVSNKNNKYIPIDAKQITANNKEINIVISKSWEPSKSKFGAGYKAALHELKMQWKKNNSSSRGRKKVVKLDPTTKMPPQATVWNSNTSRKTPNNNTKFGPPPVQFQPKNFIMKENKRFANLNIKKKKIVDKKPPPLDSNMTSNIIKMIRGMQKKMPKPGVHYRARTTEIGNSRHIKRQPSKKVGLRI